MTGKRWNWAALLGWAGFCGWLVLLWYFSSHPAPDLPKLGFRHADKFVHFVYFASGGSTLSWALAASFQLSKRNCFRLSLLVMASIGALDEWRQVFNPRRHGDFWDFSADVAGAAVGIAIALWLYEHVRRRLG